MAHRYINLAGLNLIKGFEGLAKQLPNGEIEAYLDPVGVPTIGYGHTRGVHMGMIVSLAQCEDWLKEDIFEFENWVSTLVIVPLTDNEFAALVSFTFNLGPNNLRNSHLLRLLNAGDPKATVAAEFPKWSMAGGHVLAGLLRRRQAEAELFMMP